MGKPAIGLSLSGGGARGAAHIGLLRALEEADWKPQHLVGVSAGAIVAAMYAAGRTPDAMLQFLRNSSVYRLLGFGLPRKGLTSINYLRKRLQSELGEDTRFEDLELPLHIGITNLNEGEIELRSQGPLIDVISASSAIPFLFKPVEIDGQQYVDGGIISNMPVQPLFDAKVDFIIGSNLMPALNLPPTDLSSIFGIMWRSFDLSIIANTRPCLERCDFVFEPAELKNYNIFAFSKMEEIHDLGYEYARQQMPELLDQLASLVAK